MIADDAFDPDLINEETLSFNVDLSARLARAPTPTEVPLTETRKARAEGKGLFPPAGPLSGSNWVEIPGAPGGPGRVRLSLPATGPVRGVYLHIHGGGWSLGAPDQYDGYCQRIAAMTGLAVASVHYRLSPEHRWPGCADDCEAAARWAMQTYAGPMVIGGESAGAHLSAITLLRLRDSGDHRRVAATVLNYGCFDLGMTPSARNWGEEYMILSTPVIAWFAQNLLNGGDAREASPLWADLSDLPPALFQVGTLDPLLDDTIFMAGRWRAAGNKARLALVPGGVHAFDCFDLKIARVAHSRQDEFVNACLKG
ncbi:MAG: alpha/beta hydrolase [Pseudomonadota bacterium]